MPGFLVLAGVPVVAGVVAGFWRGGSLDGIAGGFRGLWLLWLAVGTQVAHAYLGGGAAFLALTFLIVLGWVAVNLAGFSPGMRGGAGLVLGGAVMNGVAIAVNGAMPYSAWAAEVIGLPAGSATAKNEPETAGTRLMFLADVIPVPGLQKIVSLGDVAISVGSALLIAAAMRRHPRKEGEPS
ncbi:DUF5317 family protein [Bailinhaonella thermotolerans]|uniref:DUF5317 domain-containing protein n=1 Tax=Bailinhaonella thermotolerans TaxID=1070861 RepID=A0A3A4BI27_9ACTN|nr:DUF5317 family protein [Bailinhaonella thermotolerans]RJL30902.1 hypothetical protein D5H75_21645 [Bailinhaonella thermotolerans]